MYFNSQHKLMYHALSTGRDDFQKMTREILTISENLNKGTDLITNGNRTECGRIRSEIIPAITKSDDRAARIRFVYNEYAYRPNWTTRSLITN